MRVRRRRSAADARPTPARSATQRRARSTEHRATPRAGTPAIVRRVASATAGSSMRTSCSIRPRAPAHSEGVPAVGAERHIVEPDRQAGDRPVEGETTATGVRDPSPSIGSAGRSPSRERLREHVAPVGVADGAHTAPGPPIRGEVDHATSTRPGVARRVCEQRAVSRQLMIDSFESVWHHGVGRHHEGWGAVDRGDHERGRCARR
jgi:hypothetical protein